MTLSCSCAAEQLCIFDQVRFLVRSYCPRPPVLIKVNFCQRLIRVKKFYQKFNGYRLLSDFGSELWYIHISMRHTLWPSLSFQKVWTVREMMTIYLFIWQKHYPSPSRIWKSWISRGKVTKLQYIKPEHPFQHEQLLSSMDLSQMRISYISSWIWIGFCLNSLQTVF